MKETVHVGIGEGGHVLSGVFGLKVHLLVAGLRLHLVEVLFRHEFEHGGLDLLEVLEAWLITTAFLLNFFNHCCYFVCKSELLIL